MRKVIRTCSDAIKKVQELSLDVEVRQYGGSVTSDSLFYNKVLNVEFTSTLHTVIKHLQKKSINTLGLRSLPKKIVSKQSLEDKAIAWLHEHIPDATLVSFAGNFSEPSTFERCGVLTTISFNRLKDRQRRGLQLLPTWEETLAKRLETKKACGQIKLVEGKTLKEHAEELGVAYSTFQSTLKHQGLDQALALSSKESQLEVLFKQWYPLAVHNKKLGDYRPDFRFDWEKLVVECDGLYWHSDAVLKDSQYHVKKRAAYAALGYRSLFFRANEILNTPTIVKSIVDHKLGLSKRLYARKLLVVDLTKEEAKQFFLKNHLMGPGQGKTVALANDTAVVAALQYRKNFGKLDVSRFATLAGYAVVGGFSKLLKQLPKGEITTYIDLRYGTGSHLASLGFTLANKPRESFQWTDGKTTWHRLKYKGDTGYDHGLYKIWDCGHALWYLSCKG